jgi:CubicO group peptidase (beta-lactamase class C family)
MLASPPSIHLRVPRLQLMNRLGVPTLRQLFRSVLLGFAALLWTTGSISAQPAPLAGLDAYVEQALHDWEIPGLALAVVQGDSLLHARGYGVTRLDGDEEVDEHTLFAIASTTKAMTVAALGILVDEGQLSWDDPVSRHLPGFQVSDPYVTQQLKVRDLLTHRAGVARMDNLWIASPFHRAEILDRARHLPQVQSFREEYGYNNILYIAAGEIVESITGTSWDAFLESRIFQPLEMHRSTTRAAVVEERENVAHSHTRVDGQIQAIPRRDYDAIGGAGAAWSSASELARWVRLHLGQGEFEAESLVSAQRLEEMYTPHTPIPIDSVGARLHPTNHFLSYALGWRVQDLHGTRLVHHSGSINYTRTQITMVPDEGIGIVAMANLSSSNLQLALTHWILDALQDREQQDWSSLYLELLHRNQEQGDQAEEELVASRLPDTGPSLTPEAYVGRYEDDLFGTVTIELQGDAESWREDAGESEGAEGQLSEAHESSPGFVGLVLHYSDEYVADLVHWHQDLFRAEWRRPGAGRTFAHFTLDPQGRLTEVKLDGFATFSRVDP